MNSTVLDPNSTNELERALRGYIMAWVVVTDDGHWFWQGQYRAGKPITRKFRGVVYEIDHTLCYSGDGPWPCVCVEHIDGDKR